MRFLLWVRDFRKGHPEISVKEAKLIYEENLLKNMQWMYDLGWTEDELNKIPRSIRLLLSNPSCIEKYRANTETLLGFFDRNVVFKLVVQHCLSMLQEPDVYRSRWLDISKMLGEDWQSVMLEYIEDYEIRFFQQMMFANDQQWVSELYNIWQFYVSYYFDGIHFIESD